MNDTRMQDNLYDAIRTQTYLVNLFLLGCHICFLILFYQMDATFMYYLNYFSVATYLYTLILLQKRRTIRFVLIAYGELFIHMFFAVICLGWHFGFQQYVFCLIPATLFTDYVINKQLKLRKITCFVTALYGVSYLFLRLWTYSHNPVYYANDTIRRIFYFLNAIAVLIFITIYVLFFANTAYRNERHLHVMADYDPLTGLYNRRKMYKIMQHMQTDFKPDTEELCIGFVDVDYFKKINDTYGHASGDEVLKQLSSILKSRVRMFDNFQVSRWGGEEFLFAYKYNKENANDLPQEMESLRKEIEQTMIVLDDIVIHFTISMGISYYHIDNSIDEAIEQADNMLYTSKHSGRNCIHYG